MQPRKEESAMGAARPANYRPLKSTGSQGLSEVDAALKKNFEKMTKTYNKKKIKKEKNKKITHKKKGTKN